ncbi:MAG: uroporphyrinogen decarboxylase family protein, partial [bacterium]
LGVDIIWIGDDVGMQDRMLMAPELWREFLKPRYGLIFEEFRRVNPEIKTAFHTDGYVEPVIPDFIEIGLDILNPVQPKSMDPAKLKKLYGDRLTFWGTVDIQEVLPFGTPSRVEEEVKLRLKTVGRGGGLIISPAHNIQPDVSINNILAFYHAARKYGRYPLNF